MSKTTTWILIVIAFIVGGVIGFLAERQRATDKMEAYKLEVSKQIDSAKMAMEKAIATPTPMPLTAMATDKKLGSILKAENGMTLYTYDKDIAGKSTCTGACATVWPPYLVAGTPATNLPAHMSTIKLADGSMQYAWDGKALYYYSKDKAATDVLGDGVGGVWHVVK